MLGKKNKDTPVTEITKEDQEWMAKQAMSVFEKRAKKAIKKESKRQITKRDKIKAVAAGVVASAGAMVVYNFAVRKMIQKDLDAKLANKQEITELVFEEIAKQYPTYIPESMFVKEHQIVDLASELYQDGKQQEAQIILDLLNGLNSGTFQVGDIHNFLVNNNLSTVATNMSPSQADIENALYEAYESVYGFNPQGMTDREVIENIIDLHMRPVGEPTDSTLDLYWMFEDLTREQRMQLNKVHEDYILLLNKTTNVHNTNAHNITEAQVDALIQSKQGIWVSPYRGDETTSFVDKLDYVVSQMEWEIAGYAGNPDMQLLLSIQGTMDQGSTYDLNKYTDYMNYRLLYENQKSKTDLMSTNDVLNVFGYEGNILGEYSQMGTDDYIFARVMEDKYPGLDCVKDNGQINLSDTSGLTQQQISDYQVDLSKYTEWKNNNTTTDLLEGVQSLGYLSQDYQDKWVDGCMQAQTNNPIITVLGSLFVGGCVIGGYIGYQKYKLYRSRKFIKTLDEEMTKRGLTDADFAKRTYSFEKIEETNEQQNENAQGQVESIQDQVEGTEENKMSK